MPARSVVSPVSYASRPPQVSLVSGQPMSAATCSGIARTTGLLAIDAPLRGVKPDAAARNRSSHVEERDPHVGQIDRAAGTSDAGKGDAVLGRDHGCHLSRIRSRDLDCYTTAPTAPPLSVQSAAVASMTDATSGAAATLKHTSPEQLGAVRR